MLRDLIVTILMALAVAVFFTGEVADALLLLCVALGFIVLGNNAHHIIAKQLNYLASRLTRLLAGLGLLAALALLLGADRDGVVLGLTILIIALLPLGIPLAIRGHFALSDTSKAQHNAIKIIRASFTANAAFIGLILVMFAGAAFYNFQPVIAMPQLLLVSLLLALPLSKLKADPPHGKAIKVSAHNLYTHTMSMNNLSHYVKSGVLAGGLAYASYLLLFALNNLSARFVDVSLPLHVEATTLASLTLLLCLFANILFERQDHYEVFSFNHFTQRAGLLRSMGLALLIFVVATSLPGLRSLFDTSALGIVAWALAIVLTGVYIGLRRLQRYMREHSRHAVLKLHQFKE
jgi:hypothetical protein